MEIFLLALALVTQIAILFLAYWKKAAIIYLFAGFVGLGALVPMVSDNGNIDYVSNGVTVTINSGGFFILVPTLLTILCFVAAISIIRD